MNGKFFLQLFFYFCGSNADIKLQPGSQRLSRYYNSPYFFKWQHKRRKWGQFVTIFLSVLTFKNGYYQVPVIPNERISYLVIWQDTGVPQSMDVAINLPFEVGHAPAKVDEEESNAENDLQASAGQVRPVADIGKSEALHDFMQIFHILSG